MDYMKVFLSHSSKDKPIVRLFAHDLKNAGCIPWLDEVELKIGDSLIKKISDAITDATYVIAFLSEYSVESSWVQHELETAMTESIYENRIIILPVLLPGITYRMIPSYLRKMLYCDLTLPANYDQAIRQLLRRITPENPSINFLKFTASRHSEILDIINQNMELKNWIFQYLTQSSFNNDPTERYWVYVTIGGIRHSESSDYLLLVSQNEKSSFAKKGIVDALEMITKESEL